jgi:hypothetical protein
LIAFTKLSQGVIFSSPLSGSKVLAFDIVENKGYKGFAVLYDPAPANIGKLLGDNLAGWCFYDMMTEGQVMAFVGDIDIHSQPQAYPFAGRFQEKAICCFAAGRKVQLLDTDQKHRI